jgi:predicted transcriptional regulator
MTNPAGLLQNPHKGGKGMGDLSHPAMDIIKNHQINPPVDVIEIARAFGLNVYSDNLSGGVSGMIVHRPEYGSSSGYSIIVNSGEPQTRQRFTVAHEIAHFVLHRDKIRNGIEDSTLYRAASMSNHDETQANRLAAEILMPHHLLLRYAQEHPRTAREMANIFNVSEVAMSIRLGLPT